MPKSNKQVIVDYIIKDIEKGTDRGKVIAKYCKKFQKSDRTIDSYWKIANQQYKERQDKAKAAADEAYIKASADAAVVAVMSSQERKEILSKIARGERTEFAPNPKEAGTFIEVPVAIETLEVIKAISELNKMEGDYAPTKVANTNKDGDDIPPPLDYSKMSEKELEKLKAIHDKYAFKH
jgi:hypothetical protein